MRPRSLLPCLALACFLAPPAPVAHAGPPHRLDEDFTSLAWCDTSATTAWWDTTAGELKLPPFAIERVGGWDSPGTAYGVAVDGDLVCLADGSNGVQLIDLADPANPAPLGTWNTPGQAFDAAIEGETLYVADYIGGLQVIDISDPAAPALLGSATTANPAMTVIVSGDLAYLAVRGEGIQIFDVTDPSAPVSLGLGDTPGTAFDVAIAGDRAYVADGAEGLQILDVSDATAPVLLGGLDTPQFAYGVDIQGDRAYVADNDNGLFVIDVSDPAGPVLLGNLDTPGTAWHVLAEGNRVYVSDWYSGVHAVDVSDPTDPVLLHSWDSPGTVRDIRLDGPYALVADYGSGLHVLEVRSRADDPRLLSVQDTPGSAYDAVLAGDLVYVAANSDGLQVVDISDPLQPTLVGEYTAVTQVQGLCRHGDLVLLANYVDGLLIVDVSDPTLPVLVGDCNTLYRATAVVAAGDLAYVADNSAGLTVVDISDPALPTVLQNSATPGEANDILLAGDLCYVADGSAGLSILDISDPMAPQLVGSYDTYRPAEDLARRGDYVYLATGLGYVKIVDVSDPAAPFLAETLIFDGSGRGVTLVGDVLYVAAYDGGYKVYDVSDPLQAVHLATYDPGPTSLVYGVAAHGSTLVGASGGDGVHFFEIFADDLRIGDCRGQSRPLGSGQEKVVRVRLSATQTDSVRWEVSGAADLSGSVWQDVVPDWTWHEVYEGTDPAWRSQHVRSQAGINPSCSELSLEWTYACAVIDSIVDLPEDQGGSVRLHFLRSGYDFAEEADSPVSSYGVWQRVDDAALADRVRAARPAAESSGPEPSGPTDLPLRTLRDRSFLAAADLKAEAGFPPGLWELVTTVPAVQQNVYQARATTAADIVASVFCLTTHTITPAEWYCSPPDSGSSLDNIAPAVPSGLHLEAVELLAWDEPVDEDFHYFSVYGSPTPALLRDAVLIDHTTGTSLPIPGTEHAYYLVTASDPAGNESSPAVLDNTATAVPGGPPLRFSLQAAAPNPFNPATVIRYDLPRACRVDLEIFAVDGRRVRTLVAETRTAGEHRAVWRGEDDAGRPIASGIYFCRMRADAFERTRRLALVR